MNKSLGFVLVGLLVTGSVEAARVRNEWTLAWDQHPMRDRIGKYVLVVTFPDDGGVQDAFEKAGGYSEVITINILPDRKGNGEAVLIACPKPNDSEIKSCSGPSNMVLLNRKAPKGPSRVRVK